MVNSIQDKIASNPYISYNKTYMQSPALTVQTPKTLPSDIHKKNAADWKDILAPLGLVTGGGILLYYGIKTPGKVKLFKNNIRARLFKMEAELNNYNQFVNQTVNESFEGVAKSIREYKDKRFISPSSFILNIKMLHEPKQVSRASDLAFEAIARSDLEYSRPGASDAGNFAVQIDNALRGASNNIEYKKEQTKLYINDLVNIPKFKDGKHSDLIEDSEDQLIAAVTSISQQMDKTKDTKLHAVVKDQFRKVADVITTSRKLRTETKEMAIDTTFSRISDLLELEDFTPAYSKIPTLENYEKLTEEQLKAAGLPKAIQTLETNNIYLHAVKTKDFNSLTEEDLYEIFYKSSYNNNLKDLGFLIDRLRVKQEIAKAVGETANADSLNVVIAKLEYLLNRLHTYGSEELIKKAQRDFHNMNVEQRKAALYYVSTVSRRLGFDTVQGMDKYFAKNNELYNSLNIREYMDIFEKSPELYFI